MKKPDLIENCEDLKVNLDEIESYLNDDALEENFLEMVGYISRGHNFVCYRVGAEYHFVPSRFVGYKKNTLSKHKKNRNKGLVTGTDTDRILSTSYLLGKPITSEKIDKCYIQFCTSLGVEPPMRDRRFWVYNEDLEPELKSTPFTEGSVYLRTHKLKERNRKIIGLAKASFKVKHDGKLFCEKCDFCFEDVYGKLGKDFIEAHHKVPLSQINEEHEVSIDDFMMVCSNCHSMLHRKGCQNNDIFIKR